MSKKTLFALCASLTALSYASETGVSEAFQPAAITRKNPLPEGSSAPLAPTPSLPLLQENGSEVPSVAPVAEQAQGPSWTTWMWNNLVPGSTQDPLETLSEEEQRNVRFLTEVAEKLQQEILTKTQQIFGPDYQSARALAADPQSTKFFELLQKAADKKTAIAQASVHLHQLETAYTAALEEAAPFVPFEKTRRWNHLIRSALIASGGVAGYHVGKFIKYLLSRGVQKLVMNERVALAKQASELVKIRTTLVETQKDDQARLEECRERLSRLPRLRAQLMTLKEEVQAQNPELSTSEHTPAPLADEEDATLSFKEASKPSLEDITQALHGLDEEEAECREHEEWYTTRIQESREKLHDVSERLEKFQHKLVELAKERQIILNVPAVGRVAGVVLGGLGASIGAFMAYKAVGFWNLFPAPAELYNNPEYDTIQRHSQLLKEDIYNAAAKKNSLVAELSNLENKYQAAESYAKAVYGYSPAEHANFVQKQLQLKEMEHKLEQIKSYMDDIKAGMAREQWNAISGIAQQALSLIANKSGQQ